MARNNALDVPFGDALCIVTHDLVVYSCDVIYQAPEPYGARMRILCESVRHRSLLRCWSRVLLFSSTLASKCQFLTQRTSVHGRFINKSDCMSVFVGLWYQATQYVMKPSNITVSTSCAKSNSSSGLPLVHSPQMKSHFTFLRFFSRPGTPMVFASGHTSK